MLVKFPPGGSSPPHRHGGASVSTHAVEGRVLNKTNDDPMKPIETGGSWHEAPGCHHKISANYSDTTPATIMAVFVVHTAVVEEGVYGALVRVDEEYADIIF
jgi:quercetin dioxygenase-like cupin family protein